MVANVTSLSGNGLKDWLVQRVSALVLAVYVVFLFVYVVSHNPLSFQKWQDLFACTWMRIGSLLALIALILHAWVGFWTVTTDYIKPTVLRLAVQMLVLFCLFACLVWGITILWGL